MPGVGDMLHRGAPGDARQQKKIKKGKFTKTPLTFTVNQVIIITEIIKRGVENV